MPKISNEQFDRYITTFEKMVMSLTIMGDKLKTVEHDGAPEWLKERVAEFDETFKTPLHLTTGGYIVVGMDILDGGVIMPMLLDAFHDDGTPMHADEMKLASELAKEQIRDFMAFHAAAKKGKN